jgi:hypothetical protein
MKLDEVIGHDGSLQRLGSVGISDKYIEIENFISVPVISAFFKIVKINSNIHLSKSLTESKESAKVDLPI